MPEPIRLVVHGTPATAGSKRGVPIKRKDGSVGVQIFDDSTRSKPWQAAVANAGAKAMQGRPLLRDALVVSFTFYRARPKGHHGRRGLLPSAPRYPATRPDVLKLARCAEDALTGVIWADDAQIVVEQLLKMYGEPERLVVEVRRVTAADAVLGADDASVGGPQLRAL